MKNSLSYLFCLTTTVLFSQTTEQPMFSEQLIQYNPAATGLFYQRSGFLASEITTFRTSSLSASANGTLGYHQKIGRLKGGLGVTFGASGVNSHEEDFVYFKGAALAPKLHYSYQYAFKDGSVLSGGAAIGFATGSYSYDDYPYLYSEKTRQHMTYSNVYGNLGVMYKRPKWYVGVSTSSISIYDNVTTTDTSYQVMDSRIRPTVVAGYLFNVGKKVTLQPQVVFAQHGQISLVATYNQKYWMKTSYTGGNRIGLMVGMNVNDRFRVGYGLGNLVAIGGRSSMVHQLNLSFLLK